jgi:DnaJ-class molecular chaperone
MTDYYKELGVASYATVAEIGKAYHALALENHPDKTIMLDDEERAEREGYFKRLVGAFEVLSDIEKRAAYDATISRPPPCAPNAACSYNSQADEARRAEKWRRKQRKKQARHEKENEAR